MVFDVHIPSPRTQTSTLDTPERIIGDKAYGSDALDEDLDDEGIELIAPHRSNRTPQNKTQDGRTLRRYSRHWTVERTISWFQNFRRLCIRYEKSTMLFQGFLHQTGSGIASRKTEAPKLKEAHRYV